MMLLLMTLLGLVLTGIAPGESSWHFVLPLPGDPFEHPPLRALVLSREKPEDLMEKIVYRGANRRYAAAPFWQPGFGPGDGGTR